MAEMGKTRNESGHQRRHGDLCGTEDWICPGLTEEDVEKIAERAAEVALEKVYTRIGRSVVEKFLWVVGAASLAIFAYFKGKGVT